MILVGIDNIDRYRDLRPLNQDGTPAGIENYTRFLVEEVFPFVEANYRTARYRILAGPQAGAVFGLATLQSRPDLSDAFILNNQFGSPPNAALLLERAASFYAADGRLRKFCYVTHGEAAESPAAAAALVRLAEIEAFYGRQSERYGYEMTPPEFVMTLAADVLLQRKEHAQAIQILERQTTLYPGLLNGWWRLAGVAAECGETARAIALDPSARSFAERRIVALEAAGAR